MSGESASWFYEERTLMLPKAYLDQIEEVSPKQIPLDWRHTEADEDVETSELFMTQLNAMAPRVNGGAEGRLIPLRFSIQEVDADAL